MTELDVWHPHVIEGVCSCDLFHGRVLAYSTRCGLGMHRVRAAHDANAAHHLPQPLMPRWKA